jgi:Flp pilus assembly protein TadB
VIELHKKLGFYDQEEKKMRAAEIEKQQEEARLSRWNADWDKVAQLRAKQREAMVSSVRYIYMYMILIYILYCSIYVVYMFILFLFLLSLIIIIIIIIIITLVSSCIKW